VLVYTSIQTALAGLGVPVVWTMDRRLPVSAQFLAIHQQFEATVLVRDELPTQQSS